jgi:formylmethanofuran dehydrogenase subunit E
MKSIDDVVEFHGHLCPGLAIGFRVARAALDEFGQRAEDEELVAVVENDSCAVDAVQVMTGCTFGKGNLIYRDYGKQVYTFIRRPSGDALRVSVEWVSPEETDEEKEAWSKYIGGDRSGDVLEIVHRRKSSKIDAVLGASEGELFKMTRKKMELPREARIYPSVRCALCGEKVMEPRARLKDGNTVCLPCFEGEGDG